MPIDLAPIAASKVLPQWLDTPQTLQQKCEEVIAKELQLNNYLASIKSPTMENAYEPFVHAVNESYFIQGQIGLYRFVSTSKSIRDASARAVDKVRSFAMEQDLRVDLSNTFSKLNDLVKDDTTVPEEIVRYLSRTVISSKRNGLTLSEAERAVVKEIRVEISTLMSQFTKNLDEESGFLLFNKNELEGVPAEVISKFAVVEEHGAEKLKVNFKYADVFAISRYAKRQETRKRIHIGDSNRCPENVAIFSKLIRLRFKLAKALNYNSYSDYVLEDRMAKNPDTVFEFLHDLQIKFRTLGQQQLEKLLELKNMDLIAQGLQKQDKFYLWDLSFYHNLMLTKEHQVSRKVISEYFSLDSTITGMFKIFETIFDVKFVKVEPKSSEVWHPDVKVYAVFQNFRQSAENLKFMGWLYLDLHPRPGKHKSASNYTAGPGFRKRDGTMQYVITILICNFKKPSKDLPSLLNHSEVVTLFHELGHAMHSLLSQTDFSILRSSIEWDFAETPSQMLEYWTWSVQGLKSLSKHYKSGEQIGNDLLESLLANKNVNGALYNLRQIHFGLFDINCHNVSTEEEIDNLDTSELWNNLRAEITLVSSEGIPTNGYSVFGHIAVAQASAYYGYMYSLVHAADLYYGLFKDDPMSAESGLRYRDIILARGGTKDSMENLVDLLGRKPSTSAYFEEKIR